MTEPSDRLRAFFLATLMVMSVLAMSVSVVGVTAATQNNTTHEVRDFGLSAAGNDAVAEWSKTESSIGSFSSHLKVDDTDSSLGDEARIVIDAEDVGVSTLDDLNSMQWQVLGESGYAPHVDVIVDDGSGGEDALVFEYAKVDPAQCDDLSTEPDGDFQTFADHGAVIDNGSYAWLASGPPGPCGDSNFEDTYMSLSDWKSTGAEGINGSSEVLRFEVEVDNWISDPSEAYLDGITVNGQTYHGLIQDGVDAAADGHTVEAGPGTYNESVTVTKNISVVSTDGPSSTTITLSNQKVPAIVRLGTQADPIHPGLTFEGFTVEASPSLTTDMFRLALVRIWATGTDSHRVKVRGNVLGSGGHADVAGIVSNGGPGYLTIAGNHLVDQDSDPNAGLAYGVFLNGGHHTRLANNEIESVVFSGIALGEGADNKAYQSLVPQNMTVAENEIINAGTNQDFEDGMSVWDAGIHLHDGARFVAITRNTIEGTDGFGVVTHDRAPASDLDRVRVFYNDLIDNTVDVRNNVDPTLFAFLNWYGDARAEPANRTIEGNVFYDPFLTAPQGDVLKGPGETQKWANDLLIPRDGGLHSIAFPGPVKGNVSQVFQELGSGETLFAYDADNDTFLSGSALADREVSSLDAFIVSAKGSGPPIRLVVDYEDDFDDSPSAPGSKAVADGWNFVGSPQYGPLSDAFSGTTAPIGKVAHLYPGPESQPIPAGQSPTFVAQPDADNRVSGYTGYWVFMNDDGEIAAVIRAGVDAREFFNSIRVT